MKRSLLVCVLMLSLGAPIALAQSGDLTPAQKQEQAIKLFEEAESYYNLQEYEKALGLYKESYLLSQEPALLYNIAQCQRQTKRYEESIKSYRAFLRTTTDSSLRPQIDNFIIEMEAELKKNPTTSPSSAPVVKPETPSSLPKILLVSSGAAAGAGFASGIVTLLASNNARKQQLAELTDPALVAKTTKLARLSSTASTVTFALAIGAGGAGYALQKKEQQAPLLSSKLLYGVSASSAAVALGAGTAAFITARGAKRLQEQGSQTQELVLNRQQLVSQLSLTADVLLAAAVLSGAGGFLLSKKTKPKTALLIAPSQLSVRVTF